MCKRRKRWGEYRYYSLDFYLRETFGEKIYKIPLDGGMSCPNRDGTLDTRGCIFCSRGGSGEFAVPRKHSVTEQIDEAIAFLQRQTKYTGNRYIAYFQSYTNTYAPVSYLKPLYEEALAHPLVAALSIATRPDCLSEEVLELLRQCAMQKPVWVELGLQTIHEQTARYIRRRYPLSTFEQAVRNLRRRNISVITHVILGLPGEGREQVLETIHYLNQSGIQGIKLQLLHVLKGTDLAEEYRNHRIRVLSREEYIRLLLDCISHLSPDIVVHRLTGDGAGELLIAPEWSKKKRAVLNEIAHQMKIQDIVQGGSL